jgi:hypothetical protein
MEYSRLEKRTSREIRRLRDETTFLAQINEEFGKENDELQSQIDRLTKYRLPNSLQQKNKKNDGEKNDDWPSAKRRKTEKKAKSKGKKAVHCTDDELEYDSAAKSGSEVSEPEFEEKDEKGARVCFNFVIFIYRIY